MFAIRKILLFSLIPASAASTSAFAEEQVEEIVVTGRNTFSSLLLSESMQLQQSSITSINSLIDNLPGVTVNEGDIYGFDDWSTSITIRGFSTNLADQQVGTTIDGLPNGGSNYGGGAKANRYIDPSNIGDVEVSLGTADIASRSLEALGGTINFITSDPETERRVRAEASVGEFDAYRAFVRYDTGTFAGDTQAWVSISRAEASDWIAQSAENQRDHFAAKLVSSFDLSKLTAYISYDDIHEDNYQRVYSEAQYQQFPDNDGLTSQWAGVPYEDQLFRQGWSTLRENLLAYVKVDFQPNDGLEINTSVYHHQNEGRGDWLPPYVINATNDNGGPESEITGGATVEGGNVDTNDRILFVDAQGNRLAPIAGCTPTYTVRNWYGVSESTAPAASDPSCYEDGAIPVLSFRNTHYEKDRTGLSLDTIWNASFANFENELRGGLWYEDQTRDEWRDWHAIESPNGFRYAPNPYWIQYSRSYPQEVLKFYLQDALTTGSVTWSLGVKQFFVDVERQDVFDSSVNTAVESDSDMLLSGGFVWDAPVEGVEVFAGYAENFKALPDDVLETEKAELDDIEPETSETIEMGLRYDNGPIAATAVVYQNDFDNRIIFLGPDAVGGPDFDVGTDGTYFNAGGIESEGLELSLDYSILDSLSLYLAYTYTDASYLGTGDDNVDNANGILPGSDVAGIADNLFVASLDWSSEVFFAGISVKHTGDRHVSAVRVVKENNVYVPVKNTWVAKNFLITDIYIGANVDYIAEGLKLNLVINNALDEEHLGTISSNAAWIGGPRTVSLSATLDF